MSACEVSTRIRAVTRRVRARRVPRRLRRRGSFVPDAFTRPPSWGGRQRQLLARGTSPRRRAAAPPIVSHDEGSALSRGTTTRDAITKGGL